MRHLRNVLIAMVALAAGLATRSGAEAATYTVDSISDSSALSTCGAPLGDCSLRGAIVNANLSGAADTINFNTAVFPSGSPNTIIIGSALILSGGGDTIDGTSAGVIVRGTLSGGNPILDCLSLDSSGNTVKGVQVADCAVGVILSDSDSDSNTIGPGNTLYGNVWGVLVGPSDANSNRIIGNKIGTNVAGTAVHPEGGNNEGVTINGASNEVGGSLTADRNIISGNGRGIVVNGAGNRINGNYIGPDVTGMVSLGNTDDGIINFGTNTEVGTGAGNIISGNGKNGIEVYAGTSTVIYRNYIGLNAAGTGALPNSGNGVDVLNGGSVEIDPVLAADRNVISGNTGTGIEIESTASFGNLISGNYIGTNAAGTADLGNGGNGIFVGSDSNTIGGTTAGHRNVISGNDARGIFVDSSSDSNTVQGNYIGTNAAGTGALGNGATGVRIDGNDNVIGGTGSGAANTIAYGASVGVFVQTTGTGNSIQGNSIHDNAGLGIDLSPANAVTPNDLDDPDGGPNNTQNFPVLTSALVSGGSTTVQGTLNSNFNTASTIDFYSTPTCDSSGNGEGAVFLGSQSVTTNFGGDVSFTKSGLPATTVGHVITATATRNVAPLDTSEFSACRTIAADTDGDGVPDSSDNCPRWANPSQAYPLQGVQPTAGDAECDGFPDSVAVAGRARETYIGTDPLVHCAATAMANDEGGLDANPMDFNDNRIYNGQDSGQFGGTGGGFGKNVADGPFYGRPGARYNLNGDTGGTGGLGLINGQDTGKYGGPFGYFNETCVTSGP